ncbi:hypothetical protein TUMEXPCC7403_04940 [Tumidithrix helvetica PCC 7403]|uniref:AMP-binding protein n=1 Tax=Tumidithrix helvetica TaxID=3457545 RepID=UPI003CBA0882
MNTLNANPNAEFSTIYEMVAIWDKKTPEATAILAPSRDPLSYGSLKIQIDRTIEILRRMGVGRSDRVALVLPESPEMAVAFLAISSCAVSAPLNPRFTQAEFERYFTTFKIKFLIVREGLNPSAREAAKACQLKIIELIPLEDRDAGCFLLAGEASQPAPEPHIIEPNDQALILHTSGTTGQPKIVPLTHLNLCSAARNIRLALNLQPSDRGLIVMPLIYSHGLLGALLSSIGAGASVVSTPGFNPNHFFDWLEEFQPTWYTSVPTLHQAAIAAAKQQDRDLRQCSLRLIRSSSAAISSDLIYELENTFSATFTQAYGLTEAYQIACHSLPPLQSKVGSVGRAVNTKIAIVDETGNFLQPHQAGEIVTQGANVFNGYEANPTANSQGFTNGWFRTGDRGYLDEDGYLFLIGRIKELINRGSEKVAPNEIDQVLLKHPKIAQAVAFAVPHPRLGEDIAAAVVLKPYISATVEEIREFASTQLVSFKVPSQIVFLDDLPKSTNGKVQRIGLAQVLASHLKQEFVAPKTSVEKTLTAIWVDVLGVEQIGIDDNFFALGGDSLQAVGLLTQIEKAFNTVLAPDTIFKTLTIANLANILAQQETSTFDTHSLLLAIEPDGSKPPLFGIHDVYGGAMCYRQFANHLSSDQPFYGLVAQGYNKQEPHLSTVEAMAERYLAEIRTIQPEGPYYLMGYSFGGLVAFEIAQQLHRNHEEVALLALFDTFAEGDRQPFRLHQKVARHFRYTLQFGFQYLYDRVAKYFQKSTAIEFIANPLRNSELIAAHREATKIYNPSVYSGKITFFQPTDREVYQEWAIVAHYKSWSKRTSEPLEMFDVPGSHPLMFQEPHVAALAKDFNLCLERAQSRYRPKLYAHV